MHTKIDRKIFLEYSVQSDKKNILPLKLILPHMKTDVIDKPLSNFK